MNKLIEKIKKASRKLLLSATIAAFTVSGCNDVIDFAYDHSAKAKQIEESYQELREDREEMVNDLEEVNSEIYEKVKVIDYLEKNVSKDSVRIEQINNALEDSYEFNGKIESFLKDYKNNLEAQK